MAPLGSWVVRGGRARRQVQLVVRVDGIEGVTRQVGPLAQACVEPLLCVVVPVVLVRRRQLCVCLPQVTREWHDLSAFADSHLRP